MSGLTEEQVKSLTNKANARAAEIRGQQKPKYSLASATADEFDEYDQALAVQRFCCALAQAWQEECNAASDRVRALQPLSPD
jgi:hypothetical protein